MLIETISFKYKECILDLNKYFYSIYQKKKKCSSTCQGGGMSKSYRPLYKLERNSKNFEKAAT